VIEKQRFRRGRGQSAPIGAAKTGRRPAWRDPRGPALTTRSSCMGWHTVAAALANPQRRIRKLWLSEKRRAGRLADDNVDTRVTPRKSWRPSLIDQRLGPDAVHQGLLAEGDPLPSPDNRYAFLPQEGIVLVLDQITDPHNVGAIMRSAAAVPRSRPSSHHPRVTRRKRPACWQNPPSGAPGAGAAGHGAKSRPGRAQPAETIGAS